MAFSLSRSDKEGDTIDFMLSKKRGEAAATAFFESNWMKWVPEKITIYKSGANNAGINTINLQLIILYFLGFPLMTIVARHKIFE